MKISNLRKHKSRILVWMLSVYKTGYSFVDAYRNKTKDIVLPVISPTSTGFINFNYYDNLGAIENKGVEFDLNYRIINNIKKGIVWTIMVNGIHNEDRIISISNYLETVNNANDVQGGSDKTTTTLCNWSITDRNLGC